MDHFNRIFGTQCEGADVAYLLLCSTPLELIRMKTADDLRDIRHREDGNYSLDPGDNLSLQGLAILVDSVKKIASSKPSRLPYT